MKNCVNCNAEIADNVQFCPKCGHRQDVAPVAYAAAAPQNTNPPPQGQPYPQQAPPYPPSPPQAPSELGLAGKRYFNWLLTGILGTRESMHLLFAAIVPFLTSLIYTLSSAPYYSWHAGGFFLVWFFTIVYIAAIPLASWLVKNFLLKEKAEFTEVFSEYSSYFNVILPFSVLAMIFSLAISSFSTGNFFYALYKGILLLVLMAGVATLVSKDRDIKKTWLTLLIMGGAFILLTFIIATIETHAAVRWAKLGRRF